MNTFRETIRNIKEHDQTGAQRSRTVNQYDANYNLVRQVSYGKSEELVREEDFKWEGNKNIGLAKMYSGGTIYGTIYDTTEYADNSHLQYTRISARTVFDNSESWTVNSYAYDGNKLKNYKAYTNGVLYREMNYSYSGNYCFGVGNNYDNASGTYDTDTSLMNANGLEIKYSGWYISRDGSGSMTRREYSYKEGATHREQQNSYRYNYVFYNAGGQVFMTSEDACTYTWKGDSIRYGISADGFTTDTTYFYVIYK